MNVTLHMFLTGGLLPDGRFFLKAEDCMGNPVHPERAAACLFAWDEHSFFGTFIEKTDQVILLEPLEALRFLVSPGWLEHVTFTLSEDLAGYRTAAGTIMDALAAGNFLPSFSDWQNGRYGWKLADPREPLPASGERLLSLVINDLLSQRGGVRNAWNGLLRQFPALDVLGEDMSPHLGESEWLQTIGLVPDNTPFRTCLQLLEPKGDESDWSLKLLLQDRDLPDRVFELLSEDLEGQLAVFPLTLGNQDETAPTGNAIMMTAMPDDWREYRHRLRRDIEKCKEILPWMDKGANDTPLSARLSNEQAWTFLTEHSLQLVQAGIHVFLPVWWEQVKRTKPRVKIKVSAHSSGRSPSFFGINQVMDFEWKLALGPLELSEAEFRRLLDQKQRLLKVQGQWVQLTPALFAQMQETLKGTTGKNGLTLREVMKLYLAGTEEPSDPSWEEWDRPSALPVEVELNRHLFQFMAKLQDTKRIPLIEQPPGFQGELRNYQREGSSWLLFLRQFGLGACLADDMGLGKTIQFITYLLFLKETESRQSPSLLICPTSVIGNWQKELQRFAPSLSVYVHYGTARHKNEAFIQAAQEADLVITSYSLSHLDEQELASLAWSTICLDEAQHIKNAQTKQATSIRSLRAGHRIALTGTPIENRLTELWSIFDFLNPGYLGSLRDFSQRFVHPIERDQDQTLVQQVQRLIQPFLLRRVKTDPHIQLDLPALNEGKEYVTLTAEQGALYETTIQSMFDRLDQASPMQRRGLILTTLTRLKQLCDHPGLIDNGLGAPDEKTRSPKIERLLELISDIRQKGERSLIFTQYIEMGKLLQRVLEREGYGPVLFLNGSTPKEQRDWMISRFQDTALPDSERASIFILSLRAGGTGLNLTEANHVFHIDRWWNPAVEKQATDRAYRIGQQRNVQVYKFISLGTIEEKIDEMMERKLSLSEKIVGNGENWITELSTQELRELFLLRSEWLDLKG
ncbi:DEAD/DEAH box helicase [Brevibacillus borstelensis]|uniref:DEAD/DEAH box helicase n=1 Tax=Brevibacillus borstelensis TaxID=45462 RepID=UPI003D1F30D5